MNPFALPARTLAQLRKPTTIGDRTFSLPELATLFQRPSWVNNRGRPDRSACLELRAQDIWRLAEYTRMNIGAVRGSRRKDASVSLIATGAYAIDPRQLMHILRSRQQRQRRRRRKRMPIAGSFRTEKANAMKERLDERLPTPNPELRAFEDFVHPDLPRKSHGLGQRWVHTLRLEHWQLHRYLDQHFLICPTTHEKPGRYDFTHHPRHREWYYPLEVPRPRKPRFEPRLSHQAPKHCCGKVMKLFMPLATEQEVADAATAREWLGDLDSRIMFGGTRPNMHIMHKRQFLLQRYGPLFDRRFVCRQCLGLRYGEVKRPRNSTRAERRSKRLIGDFQPDHFNNQQPRLRVKTGLRS